MMWMRVWDLYEGDHHLDHRGSDGDGEGEVEEEEKQ